MNLLADGVLSFLVEDVEVSHVESHFDIHSKRVVRAGIHAGDVAGVIASVEVHEDLVTHQLGDLYLGIHNCGDDPLRLEVRVVNIFGADSKGDRFANIGLEEIFLFIRDLKLEGTAVKEDVLTIVCQGCRQRNSSTGSR